MTIYRWAWFALAVLGVVASLYVYARLHRYEWRADGWYVLDHWTQEVCRPRNPCVPIREAGNAAPTDPLEGYRPDWRDSSGTSR
jgi:hypothetical protein